MADQQPPMAAPTPSPTPQPTPPAAEKMKRVKIAVTLPGGQRKRVGLALSESQLAQINDPEVQRQITAQVQGLVGQPVPVPGSAAPYPRGDEAGQQELQQRREGIVESLTSPENIVGTAAGMMMASPAGIAANALRTSAGGMATAAALKAGQYAPVAMRLVAPFIKRGVPVVAAGAGGAVGQTLEEGKRLAVDGEMPSIGDIAGAAANQAGGELIGQGVEAGVSRMLPNPPEYLWSRTTPQGLSSLEFINEIAPAHAEMLSDLAVRMNLDPMIPPEGTLRRTVRDALGVAPGETITGRRAGTPLLPFDRLTSLFGVDYMRNFTMSLPTGSKLQRQFTFGEAGLTQIFEAIARDGGPGMEADELGRLIISSNLDLVNAAQVRTQGLYNGIEQELVARYGRKKVPPVYGAPTPTGIYGPDDKPIMGPPQMLSPGKALEVSNTKVSTKALKKSKVINKVLDILSETAGIGTAVNGGQLAKDLAELPDVISYESAVSLRSTVTEVLNELKSRIVGGKTRAKAVVREAQTQIDTAVAQMLKRADNETLKATGKPGDLYERWRLANSEYRDTARRLQNDLVTKLVDIAGAKYTSNPGTHTRTIEAFLGAPAEILDTLTDPKKGVNYLKHIRQAVPPETFQQLRQAWAANLLRTKGVGRRDLDVRVAGEPGTPQTPITALEGGKLYQLLKFEGENGPMLKELFAGNIGYLERLQKVARALEVHQAPSATGAGSLTGQVAAANLFSQSARGAMTFLSNHGGAVIGAGALAGNAVGGPAGAAGTAAFLFLTPTLFSRILSSRHLTNMVLEAGTWKPYGSKFAKNMARLGAVLDREERGLDPVQRTFHQAEKALMEREVFGDPTAGQPVPGGGEVAPPAPTQGAMPAGASSASPAAPMASPQP